MKYSLLLAAVVVGRCAAVERSNIVVIFSDDQGVNDVGCYGSDIPTPNIDRIAEQGVRFTSWYSASSICTPSRYGLLTGRNPVRSRDQLLSALMFLSDQDRGLRQAETTVAEKLGEAGYRTAMFGKWHLGHGAPKFLPIHHGFQMFKGHTGGCIDYFTMTYGIQPDWYEGDRLVSRNGYATELIAEEADKWLRKAANQDRPFFLYLPFNAPHFGKGWSPADQRPVNIMQAQAAELRRVGWIRDKVRREFAAMVVALDDAVGRICQTLEDTGLAENTLLIFLTDHGGDPLYGGSNLPLRGRKATLFEGGIKVPCVMRWPGRIAPGTVSNQVVWSLDLFPTLCELAGVSPGSVDGLSLLQHLKTGRSVPDREMFWMTGTHAELGRKEWRALRDRDWKYVRDAAGKEYLFRINADAREERDLAEQHPQQLDAMRERAEKLAMELRPDSTR